MVTIHLNTKLFKPVTNRDALVNPQSLDYFENLLPEVQK